MTEKIQPKIQGHEVTKNLQITPGDLLEMMKGGLQAYTEAGYRVYDNGNDTCDPPQCEREVALRKWSINEIRKNWISFGTIEIDKHVSEFPEGWYGIDYSPPKDSDGQRKFWDAILSLYFACDDIRNLEKKGLIRKAEGFLPCQAGTKWHEVTITLLDLENVHIRIRDDSRRYHFSELQLADKRKSGEPQQLWNLLISLLKTTHPDSENLSKAISRLNLHLQKIFGIKDPAFKPYKKNRGYVPKFNFSDKRGVISEKIVRTDRHVNQEDATEGSGEILSIFKEESQKWG